MSYLIIEEEPINFYIVSEITEQNKKDAKYNIITIIDLETKEFYVENDTWQKITEQ